MDVTLQAAGSADFDRLAEFMRQLRDDDPMPGSAEADSFAAMGQLVADPALGRAWLIRVGPADAGYVALTFVHSLELGGRCAYIDEFLVASSFRGRGIGREAIRLVEEQSRTLGVRVLLLEVSRANSGAVRLYDRCGFAPRRYNVMYKRLVAP